LKGIYILLLRVKKHLRIRVGSLGVVDFDEGEYVYVGSAQNSVEKRLRRHLRKRKLLRWHIDYLTTNPYVQVLNAFIFPLSKPYECKAAGIISSIGETYPIPKFGSTDCRCRSHLFRINTSFRRIISRLESEFKTRSIGADLPR